MRDLESRRRPGVSPDQTPRGAVTPLREAFSGINARFHLVGFYTLAYLMLRFLLLLGPEDDAWAPLAFAALVVVQASTCAIIGRVFEAAAGETAPRPLAQMGFGLFLPLLWLTLKIYAIVFVPPLLILWPRYAGADPAVIPAELIWAAPIAAFAVEMLKLYSQPLTVLAWRSGRWGASVLAGAAAFRVHSKASARLSLLLVASGAIDAALLFLRLPPGGPLDPDIGEGIGIFVKSYLTLVALFAATRVLLAAPATEQARPAADAAGPPA